MVSRYSRWPPKITKRNNLSNSESLCRSNASHQVSAQSNLQLGRRCRLKNLKIGHLGDWNGTILAILNFYVVPMRPIEFRRKPTYGWGGDVV